jgi:hypothetical protein
MMALLPPQYYNQEADINGQTMFIPHKIDVLTLIDVIYPELKWLPITELIITRFAMIFLTNPSRY